VDRLQAAIERLTVGGVDIVLLDLNLPDSRGLETLDALYARFSSVPIVVLTGLADEQTGVQAVRQGAQDYLVKGQLGGRYLLRSMNHALERQHLLAQLERHARALKAGEERLRRIIEANADAMVVIDAEGLVRFANPAAVELLGKQPGDLLGQPFGYDAEVGAAEEVEIERPAGDRRVAEMRVTAIPWRQQPMRLASLRDISKRKLLEQAEKELAQMKEDFVANVTHELRTPLASIKGFVDLLRDGMVPDPAVQQEFLGRVAEQADRLSGLINDLLDVASIEAGYMQLALRTTDLSAVVLASVRSLESLALDKRISVTCHLPDAAVYVDGDKNRLQQVLVNLVGNAIKFSEVDRAVEITVNSSDGLATVTVTDQGPGIAPNALPRLFDRFYQASQAHHGGTGLGLYISQRIIEAHGGHIEVQSEEGKGSSFYFTLATVSPPAQTSERLLEL
jgi:signal transduction histidine kinase